MDRTSAWQLGVPSDWQARISQLVDEYTDELGVSKGALARAMGFGKDLSPSSFGGAFAEARRQRLLDCLSPGNLPVTTAALGVGISKYKVVESFFSNGLRAIGGWHVVPEASRGTLRESVDWGFVGVELFDKGQWEAAIPYLNESWNSLTGGRATDDQVGRYAVLRVGTQLLSRDGYVGHGAATPRRLQELNRVARASLQGAIPGSELVRGIGLYYVGAAVAHRHLGSLPAREIVGYSRKAAELFAAGGGQGDGSYIAALRDQAKPLVYSALTGTSRLAAGQGVAEGCAALRRAEEAAGGKQPYDELREEWVFTRMTWIECLAALSDADAARRLWDECWLQDWLPGLVDKRRNTPLASKCAVAEMSVLASEGNLDGLAACVEEYLIDPANAAYADRERRVRQFMRYANEPSPQLLIDAIVK